MTPQKAADVSQNIVYTTDYEQIKNCKLVIEAATEDIPLKQKIFELVENIVDPGTIITGILLHNLRIIDPGEQAIKVNAVGAGTVDHSTLECSRLQLTDAGRPHIRNNCYTGGLDAHEAGVGVDEPGEDADRVRAPADAGIHPGGKPAVPGKDLFSGLCTDNRLEPGDHLGEWRRPAGGAKNIVRGVDIGDPVPEGLVDGILEGVGPGVHRHHLGAHEPHSDDVELLPPHVLRTHVNSALETEQGRRGRDQGRRHRLATRPQR